MPSRVLTTKILVSQKSVTIFDPAATDQLFIFREYKRGLSS